MPSKVLSRREVIERVGKSEELSPEARGNKKAYERWSYGVPFCLVLAGVLTNLGLPLALVALVFLAFLSCLYLSQKNYSPYKSVENGGRS
jgi:hypothetical protein